MSTPREYLRTNKHRRCRYKLRSPLQFRTTSTNEEEEEKEEKKKKKTTTKKKEEKKKKKKEDNDDVNDDDADEKEEENPAPKRKTRGFRTVLLWTPHLEFIPTRP